MECLDGDKLPSIVQYWQLRLGSYSTTTAATHVSSTTTNSATDSATNAPTNTTTNTTAIDFHWRVHQ
jgi:hypothetical protein